MRERLLFHVPRRSSRGGSGGSRGQDEAELKVSPWPNVGALRGDGIAQKFYIR